MSGTFRWTAAAIGALTLSLCMSTAQAAGATTVYYPSQAHPKFSVVVPDGWEIQPGEDKGDFVHVISPTGMIVSLRTISDKAAGGVVAAQKESVDWLKDNYNELTVAAQPEDAMEDGHKSTTIGLTGKDKEDGHAVVIAMELVELTPTLLADIQIQVNADDDTGMADLEKIMSTFKVR